MTRSLPVLATVLLALGCTHAPPPVPAKAEAPEALRARDFYPLKVGSQWTYEIEGGGHKEERTVRILREEQGYFVDNQKGALRQDARGLRDRDRYLLEEPLEAGHKWMSVLSVSATERYEVLEAGRPCSAPAGTFGRCVVVKGVQKADKGRQLELTWTYAEGVGLVHLDIAAAEEGKPARTFSQMSLVRYDPAP